MAGQGRWTLLGDLPLLRQEDHWPRLLRHDGGHQEGFFHFLSTCSLWSVFSMYMYTNFFLTVFSIECVL